MLKPYEEVIGLVKQNKSIPEEKIELLPKKWERFGNVLIVKVHSSLSDCFELVAPIYAKVLNCKSVLEDMGGIEGTARKPVLRLIWGEKNTETIHLENGIKYKFDPGMLMFSSGNMSERIRMSKIECDEEIIVDGFAGIGYFTLPLGKFGGPKKIFACEINPPAFKYLKENIELNGIEKIVEPLLGDYREVAPECCADRIILGYFKTTSNFLEKTMRVLKERGGLIHYHDTCSKEEMSRQPFRKIEKMANEFDFEAKLVHLEKVKSYAPGIYHVVLDVALSR